MASLIIIKNMQVIDLTDYQTSPRTCSVCEQEAIRIIYPLSGDIGVKAGSEIPDNLAGYCDQCNKTTHLKCATPIRMGGATMFSCPHDRGALRT